jgi:hypothetical protein
MVYRGMFILPTPPKYTNPNKFTMNILKTLLIAASALAFASLASAQIVVIEQWDFSGANPETGINGTQGSTWTTSSPNSVPSDGVLRYATSGTAAWKALPNGGVDTSTIGTFKVTVDVTDMYIAPGEQIRFFFNASGGSTGHLETKLTSWTGGQFEPDVLVGTNKVLDGSTGISFAAPSTGLGSALTMATTWDFVNDTVSFEISGPGAVGLQTTSWSNSAGFDLSDTVLKVQAIQMKTSGTLTSWMNLDTVTIETTAVPEPSTFALLAGFATLGLVMVRRRR